jgi:hypothetical protein
METDNNPTCNSVTSKMETDNNPTCRECNDSGRVKYPAHLLAYSSFNPEFEEFILECPACKG